MSLSPKFLNLQPEKVFLWLGGFFGLLFLFLTPPMQVPDEPAHFLRAWQISEGNLFADREDNRVGGWMPLSLEKFSHPYWLTIFSRLTGYYRHTHKLFTNRDECRYKEIQGF
jgi:hypothetical protein